MKNEFLLKVIVGFVLGVLLYFNSNVTRGAS